MAEARKVAPGILKKLREEHGVKEPAAPEKKAPPQGDSIVQAARKELARMVDEGSWKSPHLYENALKYMERGFGSAGDLPTKLVPRAAFVKLRLFLVKCEDIENSASSYARTICQVLRLVPGVNHDYLKLLAKLPGNKGDGEKGNTIRDSELQTILVKQWEEPDETTRILIGLGLSGGPQIVDACCLRFDEIDWNTGLITGHRVKSGEEFRFYAIPWMLALLRQRRERLGPKAIYVLNDLIFTFRDRKKPDCNTIEWKGIPRIIVNRASVNGSNHVRRFLTRACGFKLGKLTFKSFRIHRISFWASVGFTLKTRMRMAGHLDLGRHTDYARGAEFELRRASEISWRYYDAIEHGRPFFIPTTCYDVYEVIMDHWGKLPEMVRHSMREELDGSFANLEKIMAHAFAEQKAFLESKFEELHLEVAELKALVEPISRQFQHTVPQLMGAAA